MNDRKDLARKELARRELERRGLPVSDPSLEDEQKRRNEFINISGMNRGPFDIMQDIGTGAMRGAQNVAATLGEAGQGLGDIMQMIPGFSSIQKGVQQATGFSLPDVNIREELGLGKNNPVDFQNLIGSKNPNPFIQLMAQYAPGVFSGGATLPGQVASNAIYGAVQAQPEQENAFGLLPSGRGGAAIEGGVLASLPVTVPKSFQATKGVFDKYLNPKMTHENALKDIGMGKSISENINELGSRLKYGQKTAKEEALIPKREIMAESGDERIFPSQKKGEKITSDTASVFSEHPDEMTPQKTAEYQRALRKYYNDGDIDSLIERGESIFEHPGLSENQISKLDEMLIPEKPLKGEYLKIKNPDEHYSEIIQEAHDAYLKNPTFKNSDKLRSRLFKRMNELGKREKAKTITDSQEKELGSLRKNRNAIIRDQEKLIETFTPENQSKYGKFNKTWREDVRSYEDAGNTIKNMKNGHLKNVTPQNITKAMEFPELKPELQRILKDIGPSGVDNIIFNELGRTKDPKKFIEIIDNLERNKGFSSYITPKVKDYANKIRSQIRNRNIVKYGAGVAGTAGVYELAKNALK